MIIRTSKHLPAKSSPPGRENVAMRAACEGVLRQLGWPAKGPDAVRTLGLTSCRSGEGVTTLAAYLALTAAAQEAGRVLLVDANLAQPGIASFCGVQPSPGLAECLRAEERFPAAVQSSAAPNLWVLAAGKPDRSPAGIYDSAGLEPLMKELTIGYELVVFDMPPASQASCVAHLAGLLDRVLLVFEAERVRWDTAQRVRELLIGAGVRVAGGVLNKRRSLTPRWVYRDEPEFDGE